MNIKNFKLFIQKACKRDFIVDMRLKKKSDMDVIRHSSILVQSSIPRITLSDEKPSILVQSSMSRSYQKNKTNKISKDYSAYKSIR